MSSNRIVGVGASAGGLESLEQLFSAMPADTGIAVDIPATFGAPSASVYVIRFIAVSDAPNVRVRAGRVGGAPDYLTMNTQVAGIEVHIQGLAPGPSVYISTAKGSATVWLRVIGIG